MQDELNLSLKKFARDYDKEPLVIKDETNQVIKISIILMLALMVFGILRNVFFGGNSDIFKISLYFLLVISRRKFDMNFYRNAYVYFYNDKIIKIIDGEIFAEITPRQIRKLHKTVSYALPIHYGLDSVGGKTGVIFLVVIMAAMFVVLPVATSIFIILATICMVLLPQIIFHFGGGVDSVFDMIFLQGKNGLFCNFMISDPNDYAELRRYFKVVCNKNLDLAEKKITALFEVSKLEINLLAKFIIERNKKGDAWS